MPKSWDKMSSDEKLNELHRIIKDFISHSDKNLDSIIRRFDEVHHRLMNIEAAMDQIKMDAEVVIHKGGL
jgi:hypothetical protein